MGRAAWSRRPTLTRERKDQHLPPSRAGRVTFSRTLTRWSTAGRAGWHFPLTGARTGWGARSPSIPAAGVVRHHPAEQNAATGRSARRVFAVDRENGAFGPIRSDPVRKGRAPCRRGSRDAFACSV